MTPLLLSPPPPQSGSLRITKILSFVAIGILILQMGIFLVLSLVGSTSSTTTTTSTTVSSSTNNSNYYRIAHPTTAAAPVILLGLPRSGSLAIHKYMECHGWTSAHYCCGANNNNKNAQGQGGAAAAATATAFPCWGDAGPTCGDCVLKNLKGHRPAFTECGIVSSSTTTTMIWSQFDVETADAWFLPQHFALGLLHEAYPNATWILNTRGSAREWAESIYHWHGMTRRFLTTFGLPVDGTPHAMTVPPPAAHDKVTAQEIEVDMQRQLDARVYNQTEHLRKLALLQRIYENHTATIYQWARQFPSHPFLHISVDDKDKDDEVASSSSSSRSPSSILDQAFGLKGDGGAPMTGSCQWSFQSPTEDWKDFSFPFSTTET